MNYVVRRVTAEQWRVLKSVRGEKTFTKETVIGDVVYYKTGFLVRGKNIEAFKGDIVITYTQLLSKLSREYKFLTNLKQLC